MKVLYFLFFLAFNSSAEYKTLSEDRASAPMIVCQNEGMKWGKRKENMGYLIEIGKIRLLA